jgi:hypothetical protein
LKFDKLVVRVIDCHLLIFITYCPRGFEHLRITSYISVDTRKKFILNLQHIPVHTSRFLCPRTEMAPFQGITRENQNSPVEPCAKKVSSSSGEYMQYRFDFITS